MGSRNAYRERAERNRAEQARIEADQARAAEAAAALWDAGSDSGASAYVVHKSVQAHGLRFAPGGCLLVPMRDAAHTLHNVQLIYPDGRKRYGSEGVAGWRKAGLLHLLGALASAAAAAPADLPADRTALPVLLPAEGYATAATLHEATGHAATLHEATGHAAAVALRCGQPGPCGPRLAPSLPACAAGGVW